MIVFFFVIEINAIGKRSSPNNFVELRVFVFGFGIIRFNTIYPTFFYGFTILFRLKTFIFQFVDLTENDSYVVETDFKLN